MYNEKLPEVWLRGPLDEMPAMLQPVAHALMQSREEVQELMTGFPDYLLWNKVADMASPGFHLQHMAGVLDRLFTYANNKQLSPAQLSYLASEGKPDEEITASKLLRNFSLAVELSIHQLEQIEEVVLPQYRGVGRDNLPSTVIGLLVHAAEHTMRHTGQLLVTVKVLTNDMLKLVDEAG